MMSYRYANGMMGGGFGGSDALTFIAILALTADLVLLGVWLWKQITKN